MAGYDSPGFQDMLPGGGIVPQGTGAPGSPPPGAGIDAGQGGVQVQSGTPVTITASGASLVNADVAYVGSGDTLVPAEVHMYGPQPDLLTGVGADLGQNGAGLGNVVTPHHPAAALVDSIGRQVDRMRGRS